MDYLDVLWQVVVFYCIFKYFIELVFIILDEICCKFWVSLLVEEVRELEQVIVDCDFIEIVDVFCDIQYVFLGVILEFGMVDKFKVFFEEVQCFNMSKVCSIWEEVE